MSTQEEFQGCQGGCCGGACEGCPNAGGCGGCPMSGGCEGCPNAGGCGGCPMSGGCEGCPMSGGCCCGCEGEEGQQQFDGCGETEEQGCGCGCCGCGCEEATEGDLPYQTYGMDEDGYLLLTEDGGVKKKIIKEGTGDLPPAGSKVTVSSY
ncbi:hypothetical protein PIROE2DRAFT_17338 [Piromyces sp. E2]|nr:hypothetical protein PIROE2DRAFT_17338 [Piromyces sp. E2]|eukprot:OUM57616.1 hypothetical protein PIROE2DRAFT_17338 [Piromyces sp. E2]